MKKWWIQIVRYSLPQRRGLATVFLLIVLGDVLNILKPWPLKLIVDFILQGKPLPDFFEPIAVLPGGRSPLGLLMWLSAATILLFVAHQSIKLILEYIRAGVGKRMVYNLGLSIFERIQRLSLHFHGKQRSGDLVRRVMTDSSCVRKLVLETIFPALTSLASLGMMFVVMWNMDRSLAMLSILIAPMHIFLIRMFNRPMMQKEYEYEQLEGEMMALAEQTLSAIPIVQAFGRENYEDARWKKLSGSALTAYQKTILWQSNFKIGVTGTTAVGTAVVMIIGGIHVLNGSLTVGSLIVFLSYVVSLYDPMETLSYLSSGYASAAARARRVLEVLKTDEEVFDKPGAEPMPLLPNGRSDYIRFECVTFGYEPDYPVLKEVTFSTAQNETVALVGRTGVGKSTLVSLLLRLFDPWRGQITIGGKDIRDIKLASLRANIAIVAQDPFLLPITIRENIAYARPEANHDEVVAAATAANADEFICKLPQGYDTIIGERGATLSGGQKQRMAIARALLKNAPILILDEPTSALDAETEAKLLEALERLMRSRNTFIIAHRLSTIRNADKIIVLDDGKIVEQGTYHDLLAAKSKFYQFHHLQFA
jgi:ATP-binding cassette subfamily B protein/subfamily B ATP-binding cassette protein MsbA